MRISQTAARPVSPRLARSIDLPATLANTSVFAGFTAATDSSYENHDILSWTFEEAFSGGDRIFVDGFDAG